MIAAKLFVELTWAEAGAVIAGGVALGGMVFTFLKLLLVAMADSGKAKQPTRSDSP